MSEGSGPSAPPQVKSGGSGYLAAWLTFAGVIVTGTVVATIGHSSREEEEPVGVKGWL